MAHCVVLAEQDERKFVTGDGTCWWARLADTGTTRRPSQDCILLLAGGDRKAAGRLNESGYKVVRLADVAEMATLPENGNVSGSVLVYHWIKSKGFSSVDFPFAGGLAHHSICAKRQGLALSGTLLRVHVHALPDAPAGADLDGGGIDWLATEFMQEASLCDCDALVARTPAAVAWVRGRRQSFVNDTDAGNLQADLASATATVASRLVGGESRPGGDWPLVSVCLVHHERPALLAQAVQSLADQDYPNFEVVLVDDGSTQPAALDYLRRLAPIFADRGWRIARQENRYLGAARNHAARLARGEFLLFMDDDNVARRDELSVFVRVAERTSAAIVTCTPAVFRGDAAAPERCSQVWIPYGPSPAIGLVVNGFGDANALVRRSCFDSVGGFTEDYGVGHEDWEFFAKAALAGFRIELAPEPLFFYRLRESGMLRSGQRDRNLARNIRPYLEEFPELGPAHRLLQAFVENARARRPAASGEVGDLRARLQEAEGSLATLRQELDAIVASRSWRMTAPLRRLCDALRRRRHDGRSRSE